MKQIFYICSCADFFYCYYNITNGEITLAYEVQVWLVIYNCIERRASLKIIFDMQCYKIFIYYNIVYYVHILCRIKKNTIDTCFFLIRIKNIKISKQATKCSSRIWCHVEFTYNLIVMTIYKLHIHYFTITKYV